ncbi:MAG: helical backbone metal receptor, partial [Candidatus Altarchaeum sp.]|nr:helical backbone metal receptor [Candidatus Altarchaeum sp.]
MKKILPLLFGIFFVCFSFQIVFGENITCEEGTYLKNNSCVNYERVISLAPSITEIIYAINGQDNLIGVTMFCNYPEDAKSKTKIGGYVTPSVEKIISLNPDLVFAHDLTDPNDIKVLKEINITVVVINTSSNIEGIYYNVVVIAKYMGNEYEGENLINNMKEKIKKIKKIKSELIFSSPKISQIVGADPLWVSGSNTFIDDIITIIGGINIYFDIYKWQPVSVETLITRDPDIIITSSGYMGEYNHILNSPNFKTLKAVKNNDVYNINEDIISRDSPRVIDALESVIGMIISYQYNHIPKYCMDNSYCTFGKCNSLIHICFKLNDESCVFDKECICENCENGVCKEKISVNNLERNESYKWRGNYGGSRTSSSKYVYTDSENKPVNIEESVFSSEIFNISEIFGLKQTLNLGKNFKDVEIIIKIKNDVYWAFLL